MDKPEIAVLWNGLLEGDEQLLLGLYEAWYPGLLRYGLRITQDKELIQDTINQTFLYFWQNRDTLTSVMVPEAYMLTSFRRRLLRAAGSGKHRLQFPGEWEVDDDTEMVEDSHEMFLINHIRIQEVEAVLLRAIKRLSARKQELIRLKYYEGLSYSEMAARTGLTERTIYNKIHEAVKTLRDQLTADGHSNNMISAIQYLLL
ncbi:RNA polymerase sigma-70 factor (ECF subfamily) [Chitinophaga dinghuensis]|uniref:RNA polymerase sigma-70 factor (ECF subfamily) n=1 Tax=Chitinophaga dinghuensis TaxID=1539050 RepID=A0A327VYV0_9BACT|nr:sigma-70 family RNA polymerase sigma factor [Chitinophaga dinghuensis]RAJ82207.1 RNA polymerase sigma-70 factor (ECF subfamily) [Chitinophaga dinghuensis]